MILCKCGGFTNTAVSEWNWEVQEIYATKCYAKWEKDKWVKGCATSKEVFMIQYVEKLIKGDK